jgi:hypothetical protein
MLPRVRLINIGWALFVVLSSVYLVTYRGLFRSVDELALFSLTESMVQSHSTGTPQLGFSSYHNAVGRFEPLYSVAAAPLYWLAVHSRYLGNIQTAMLLNVALSAATGTLVYALLLRLRFTPLYAVVGALVYGLATIAWPYSRGFYREPLLAFLLTVAIWGFVRWRETRHLQWGVLVVASLMLAPLVKVTAALAWPAFGLTFVLDSDLERRVRVKRLLILAAWGSLGLALVAGLYALRKHSLTNLLSLWSVWLRPGVVLARVYGLTFSAGRGLFLFSPVLLLAWPGLFLLWRRERAAAMLGWFSLLFFAFGYGMYADWHGGMSWGPRFLVPLVPFLIPPVLEWVAQGRWWQRAITCALVVLSLVMQVAASTVDYSLQVEAGAWDNMLDYGRSPAVQQVLLWRLDHLDMLWLHGTTVVGTDGVYLAWGVVWPLLACLALAVASLRAGARGLGAARPGGLRGSLTGLLAVVVVNMAVRAPAAMAGYPGVDPFEMHQVADVVNRAPSPHTIVTVSNEFHLNVLMNDLKGRFIHHWLSPLQEDEFDVLLDPPFSARSLSLIVDRVHLPPGESAQAVEFWLNARLYRYFVDWVGSGYQVYSYLYPPPEGSLTQVDYRWAAGMAMTGFVMTPLRAAPGEPVWIELHCSAEQVPDADYDVFVQFLAPDGHFVNGTDGPPQFGARPTSGWQPGEAVIDRRAFFVPEDASPGVYRVIAGFYRGNERQPVFDGAGRPIGTHIELGRIEVR